MAVRPNQGKGIRIDRPDHLIPLEDAELVERIKTGDTQLYGELIIKYQDRIFNTCLRICGNFEDARDVTQDAFLKAFEKIHSFRNESTFPTWLYRIAVNLAITNKRNLRRRQTVSLDQNHSTHLTQADTLTRRVDQTKSDNPAESIVQTELQQSVIIALQNLDDEYRSVIVLRDIEGFSYDDISKILGIPQGTVKSRLFRARMILREAVLHKKIVSDKSL